MSTDLLRDAADHILKAAIAATPGPWEADGHEIRRTPLVDVWVGETCDIDAPDGGNSNATYIAAMHPGVGLALADLLYQIRASADSPVGLAATALARAVLLGESTAQVTG